MIRVHLGCVRAPVGGAIVVKSPGDYASTRQAIQKEVRQPSGDTDVYVLTRVCDDWFWDLESLPALVKLQHDDPATLLCSILALPALPADLDNPDLILHLDLLALPSPARRVGDPVAWALGMRLGSVWEEQPSSAEHFTRLVAWWVEHPAPDALVQPLLERRWEAWLARVSGSLAEAYSMLREQPTRMARFLSAWNALDGYSVEQKRRWLQEERLYREDWQRATEKTGALPLPPDLERALSAKVEAHWNGYFLNHREQEAL